MVCVGGEAGCSGGFPQKVSEQKGRNFFFKKKEKKDQTYNKKIDEIYLR